MNTNNKTKPQIKTTLCTKGERPKGGKVKSHGWGIPLAIYREKQWKKVQKQKVQKKSRQVPREYARGWSRMVKKIRSKPI